MLKLEKRYCLITEALIKSIHGLSDHWKIFCLLIISSTCLFSERTLAEENDDTIPSDAHSLYLGGKLGWNYYDDACLSVATSCDNNDFSWGLFGGFSLDMGLGIELGYTDLGQAKATEPLVKLEGEMTEWEIAATYRAALGERWWGFGKAGAAFWHADVEGTGGYSESADGYSLLMGAGLEYAWTKHWYPRIEYVFIDGAGNFDVKKADSHALYVGISYRFFLEEDEPAPEPIQETTPPVHTPPLPAPAEPPPEPGTQLLRLTQFDFNSDIPEEVDALNSTIEQLNKHPDTPILIVGHTDSKGSEAYNQQLSERRAQAVADHFYERGIARERITVEGRGESEPIATNDTPEGRAENRRVEVIVGEAP